MTRHTIKKKRKKKSYSLKRQQASELDMAGMLELSSQEFKTTLINIPIALMDKVDTM